MESELTEAEFRRLQFAAINRLANKIADAGDGLLATTVERIDDIRWVIIAHITEGELGRFKAEEL